MRTRVVVQWILAGMGTLCLCGCGNGAPTEGNSGTPSGFLQVDLPGGARMEFAWIDPGKFQMGTSEEEKQRLVEKGEWYGEMDDELPAHEVEISRGFWLGRREITQEQWGAVMGSRPWEGKEGVQEGPDYPAVYLSWNDVQQFIQRVIRHLSPRGPSRSRCWNGPRSAGRRVQPRRPAHPVCEPELQPARPVFRRHWRASS